jgi:formylglycine-generating enzyme required for sulfatase activity
MLVLIRVIHGSSSEVACRWLGAICCAAFWMTSVARSDPPKTPMNAPAVTAAQLESLRLAIEDLVGTFGDQYPHGREFLSRLTSLQRTAPPRHAATAGTFRQLRREALLANPLVDFDRLILLKRKRGQLGLPTNHQCNACLDQSGYDNEIAILSLADPSGKLETLFRPKRGFFVGEIDLHYDADRLLFSMPNGKTWEVHEIGIDGTGLRQVSRSQPGVDNFDACYLPDGRIVFASTASFTGVPCWHGKQRACCLYSMAADGSDVRQLCFDQDNDLHPAVLPNGQIIYSRWDYTGIMHIYLRPLMVMNPDGTAQRAVYGSNSYYPNALYFPRAVPGEDNKLLAILSGYHGPHRMGELVVLNTARGWREAEGIVYRVGHRGEPPKVMIRDNLVGDRWPKFLHPYPLSEKYFLVAMQEDAKSPWGIYLADVFDNFVPLASDLQHDFFEPIPIKPTPLPRILPERTDRSRDDATLYLDDVYLGAGLRGVPRGTVKALRIGAYDYGYPGMAGPDKIGRGGPWDAMRILGTVPVHEDGSAAFRVPACTPLFVQPLDAEGKAIQLMRSWYTAMPGERASCIGCHERPSDVPPSHRQTAARQQPEEIRPWYGPARGFDFAREVQPVLDRYCVACHDDSPDEGRTPKPDLRAERLVDGYEGAPLSNLGAARLEPELRVRFAPYKSSYEYFGDRKLRYTPAYEALIPYVRRVNVEDYVGLLVPGEYHADTSELVQILKKGHHGVALDAEAWDRLVTWIDLNAPCHGTWNDVSLLPGAADRRRRELALRYGGPREDPEMVPTAPRRTSASILPTKVADKTAPIRLAGWPIRQEEAIGLQRKGGPWQKTIDLGSDVTMRLVRIPAGRFVMGDSAGPPDESPQTVVSVDEFWMSVCEVTNRQLRRLQPGHFSGLFMKRSLDVNGPGISLDQPAQPAVRVSWNEAVDFCRRLSADTGLRFQLPTEAQWEYACRAGSSTPLAYGTIDADFSHVANVADATLSRFDTVTGGVIVLQDIPADQRYNDGAITTAPVGSYRPNAWGLFDMHGNAAEWTLSNDAAYPYRSDDGRNTPENEGRKVVRGGSFYDRPKRCRSAFRLSYPAWQKVHNVGFRVVCEGD